MWTKSRQTLQREKFTSNAQFNLSRLIYIVVILQDILKLRLLLRLAFRDVRGVAVVLQLIFAALRVAGFVVGILVRVVVGQVHLSKLLLRGERLSARLEVLQTGMVIKLISIRFELTGLEESSTSETKWKPR